MTKWASPLPAGCRFTSAFGKRWGTLHAGTDYGPPKAGQTGVPVFAVHDGTVIATGRGRGVKGDRIPYHSGRFIWYDIGTHGGDRMRVYVGHLQSISVKAGDKIKAGQQIGIVGGSGATSDTDFARHGHLGVAQNHNRPVLAAGKAGAPGWINFDAWIRSKGITVGTTAPVKPAAALPPAVTKPSGTTAGNVRSDASIRSICVKAGHGTASNSLGLLIERYQHRQLPPLTLVHDRVWGPRTERHYQWVMKLQAALNRWKGDKLVVDGDYRAKTAARVRAVQQNNKTGAYYKAGGRVVDGDPGPVTARMLGIPTYPN